MHLVGIGFTSDYWDELVHSIRKQSPDETLVGTLISTEAADSDQVEVLGDQISDSHPDLVIFNLLALENTQDWRNFLSRTQSNCDEQLRWVLVVEREIEELSMLARLEPEVELINGMRFPVNDPGIFQACSCRYDVMTIILCHVLMFYQHLSPKDFPFSSITTSVMQTKNQAGCILGAEEF